MPWCVFHAFEAVQAKLPKFQTSEQKKRHYQIYSLADYQNWETNFGSFRQIMIERSHERK
jgi:hypothetical protein